MAKIRGGLPQTPHLTAVELPYDPFAGTNFDLSGMDRRPEGIATPVPHGLPMNEDSFSPSPGTSPPVFRFTFEESRRDVDRPAVIPQAIREEPAAAAAAASVSSSEESLNKRERVDRREDARPHGVPLLSKRFTRSVAGIPVPEILNTLTTQFTTLGVAFYVDPPTRKARRSPRRSRAPRLSVGHSCT